jgi:hypothetical protein
VVRRLAGEDVAFMGEELRWLAALTAGRVLDENARRDYQRLSRQSGAQQKPYRWPARHCSRVGHSQP